MRPAVAAIIASALAASVLADPPKPAELPFSVRDGVAIAVQLKGPTFNIPRSWVSWQEKFKTALHLTRKEIDAVKDGSGEWDTEYAELVNATMNHDDCAFAGGGDGWGKDSCAYGDVQMRLYVTTDAPEAIEKRLDDSGAKALRKILGAARHHDEEDPAEGAKPEVKKEEPLEGFIPARDVKGTWRRSVFAFDLRYGDYGAKANVDYRIRKFGGRTVVAVFMYTDFQDQTAEIKGIMDSLKWPDAPSEDSK